jgi:hypothetical protein
MEWKPVMQTVATLIKRCGPGLMLILGIWPAMVVAAPPDILLVYWSSRDCKWCQAWESPTPGMEQQLKRAKEFKQLTYRVVKNDHLASPYTEEDFPYDISWLKDRLDRGEENAVGRPGWSLYVNRLPVARFYGTREWESKHLPSIKKLVAQYASGELKVSAPQNGLPRSVF